MAELFILRGLEVLQFVEECRELLEVLQRVVDNRSYVELVAGNLFTASRISSETIVVVGFLLVFRPE